MSCVKVLVQLRANESNRSTPLDCAACPIGWPNLHDHDKETVVKVTRLLYTETDLDTDRPWYTIRGEERFTMRQEHVDPYYYQRPLQTRLETVMQVPKTEFAQAPEVFRVALALGPIPPLIHTIVNSEGRTALHTIAIELAHQEKTIFFLSQSHVFEKIQAGNFYPGALIQQLQRLTVSLQDGKHFWTSCW